MILSHEKPIADQIAGLPVPEASSPFTQERARLRELTAPRSAVVGAPFPDPELLNAEGSATSISQLRAGRPAVVVLYRGGWCPFCNIALRVYRDELRPALRKRGVELIAVSPQYPDGSLTMQEKHDLDFPVVSDTGNQIARTLGVLTNPSGAARQAQLDGGLDLTQVNADGSTNLPMPTVAIIDAEGRLGWIDVHPDYATRTEPDEILLALEELGL